MGKGGKGKGTWTRPRQRRERDDGGNGPGTVESYIEVKTGAGMGVKTYADIFSHKEALPLTTITALCFWYNMKMEDISD